MFLSFYFNNNNDVVWSQDSQETGSWARLCFFFFFSRLCFERLIECYRVNYNLVSIVLRHELISPIILKTNYLVPD